MNRKIDEKVSIINPEFKTSIHMTDKTISVDELNSILEKRKLSILSAMRSTHMLRGEEFSFISYANFHEEYKCSIYNEFCKKRDEEIKQSKQNLMIVNDFFKSNYREDVNILFAFCDSNERCILYDSTCFTDISKLNNYLMR